MKMFKRKELVAVWIVIIICDFGFIISTYDEGDFWSTFILVGAFILATIVMEVAARRQDKQQK